MSTLGQDFWIGQRVADRRNEIGLTQQQLADRTRGKVSRSYIAMIETGQKAVDKRSTLIALAEGLGVLVEWLTATPTHARSADELAIHAIVPNLRAALDGAEDVEPLPHDRLNDAVVALMTARMECDYARLVEHMVPTVARSLAYAENVGDHHLFARVCVTASQALRPRGLLDLATRFAERGQWAAERSGDPVLVAGSIYALAQCSLAGGVRGLRARSRALAIRGAEMIQHNTSDGGMTWQAMLLLHAALSSATLGRDDEADDFLVEALRIVRHIESDPELMDPTEANVGVWKVAVTLEGQDPGRAVEYAGRVNHGLLRTVQRRIHLLMHTGKAMYMAGDFTSATQAFLTAHRMAPGEVAGRSSVREVVGQMLRAERRKAGSDALRDLAVRVGVDPLATQDV